MQSVVETEEYLKDAKQAGLSEEERAAIVEFIAKNPEAGAEIRGTGGARKVRFAGKGKGKSGGYRVITFFIDTRRSPSLILPFPSVSLPWPQPAGCRLNHTKEYGWQRRFALLPRGWALALRGHGARGR